MTAAVLSLGANLGDRLAALQGAVDLLAAEVDVVAVSPVYETEPVGGVVQPEFLNAVVLVETALAPRALLALAQRVEGVGGRVRAQRWGPRTLDVDIVAYGDVVTDDPVVTLPHPRAFQRAFVLAPWLDVEPDAKLPEGAVADLLGTARGAVRRTEHVLRVPA